MADQLADLAPRKKHVQIHTDSFLLLRAQADQVADQVADLPPDNGDLRFIPIDSYSDSSGRPAGRSSGRSTPPKMVIGDSY